MILGKVFPSANIHVKGLYVSFTDIFESEMGAALSSLAWCGSTSEDLIVSYTVRPFDAQNPSQVAPCGKC